MRRRILLASSLALAALCASGFADRPDYLAGMHWRMIGPFRGGRTVAAAGVRGKPNLFYVGVNNGGVWKTDDAGRTWTPIFDAQPTQLDRRARGRAVEPGRPLRRQRRGIAAAGPLGRRRHVQVDRWREDVEAPGPLATAGRSARSSSIPATRTVSSSPCSGIRTARTRSAACTARATAARPSRRSSIATRTRARSTSRSIPANSAHRLRRALGGAPGAVGVRQLVQRAGQRPLIARPTAGRRGSRSARVFRPRPRGWRASASASRRPTGGASTRSSRRRPGAAGSTVPTTPGVTFARVNPDERIWGRGNDFACVRVAPEESRCRSTSRTSPPTARTTADARSRRSRARRAATTTTRSG